MSASDRASSGLANLDDILGGGFVLGRLHLVEGRPGTGKTTLGMHFVLAGRDQGERVLYVSMSETRDELHAVADAHRQKAREGLQIGELMTGPRRGGVVSISQWSMPMSCVWGEPMLCPSSCDSTATSWLLGLGAIPSVSTPLANDVVTLGTVRSASGSSRGLNAKPLSPVRL